MLIFPPIASANAIPDGSIIKTANNPDVYIVKYNNGKQFRRLILNPQVFKSYGHLKWENIKVVTVEEMNSYKISNIVRVESDTKVYALAPNGDSGSKSWLNVSGTDFVAVGGDWDSVYIINSIDASNYNIATDLITQAQVKTFLNSNTLPSIASSPSPAPSVATTPTPTPTSSETWAEQEARDFAYADAKGWTSITSTNSLGEKRYYRKEGSQWVRKNSEAEIQQPYVTPPTLNQLTRLIRMCSSAPEMQAICDTPEYMPGYYSNLIFRTAIDELVVKYETIISNQQKQSISTDVLPPIQLSTSVFNSTLPAYTPPPTYYIPPPTYSPPSTNRIDFVRDPRTGLIYSSSNGTNYFYDLNGRLDHANSPFGTTQINYDLNGNLDSISY